MEAGDQKQAPEPDETAASPEWRLVRSYEGCFSAQEAVAQIIRIHMEGMLNA